MGVKLHEEIFNARVQGLSSAERLVYQAMALRAHESDRVCWASKETLSEDTGINLRTVARAWRALEDSGLIRPATSEEMPLEGAVKTTVWYIMEAQRDGVVPPQGGVVPPLRLVDRGGVVPPRGGVVPSQGGVLPPYVSTSYGGTTSSSLRSEDPRKPSGRVNLVSHFQKCLNRSQDEYGAVFGGAIDNTKMARGLKVMQQRDGLSREDVMAMMDIYATDPSAWNHHVHPWADFVSNHTVNRLVRLLRAEQEYSGSAQPSREVVTEVEVTYEEALAEYERKEREALPTWLKQA